MTQPEMQPADVERIIRDVLDARGLYVSLLLAQPTSSGWEVTLTDAADRLVTMDLPRGQPAAIREALTRWIDGWS